MNRRAFFRSVILGGIILPTLPKKLILTGGWFAATGPMGPIDFSREVLTHELLCHLHREMILGYRFDLDPSPMRFGEFKANAFTRQKLPS